MKKCVIIQTNRHKSINVILLMNIFIYFIGGFIMNELRILSKVNDFPIGESAKTRMELLSKVEIVSYLARFQEQFDMISDVEERENLVKQFLAELIGLGENEVIPSLYNASKALRLSGDFVQNYDKVQQVRETAPSFNETYDLISNSMKMTAQRHKYR